MKLKKIQSQQVYPAIPPDDYSGSIANWIINLQEMGYDNAEEYYDIYLTSEDYNILLERSEGK